MAVLPSFPICPIHLLLTRSLLNTAFYLALIHHSFIFLTFKMLGAARLGLGMLATRTGPGARLRVAGPNALGSQRGIRLFPRFFGRMNPPREQQQQQPPPPPPQKPEEKDKEQTPLPDQHKPADAGIVNPVNLPGTGVGMFGFGAGGGADAVVTTLIGIAVGTL